MGKEKAKVTDEVSFILRDKNGKIKSSSKKKGKLLERLERILEWLKTP